LAGSNKGGRRQAVPWREKGRAVLRIREGALGPRVRQSGEGRSRSGPLSKSGSRLLAWAAVEAAQQAWRESNPQHQLYLDVGPRSRRTNAAKAAVARKILIATWHMLSRHQPFNPVPRRTTVPARSRLASAA
jgi:transposase